METSSFMETNPFFCEYRSQDAIMKDSRTTDGAEKAGERTCENGPSVRQVERITT